MTESFDTMRSRAGVVLQDNPPQAVTAFMQRDAGNILWLIDELEATRAERDYWKNTIESVIDAGQSVQTELETTRAEARALVDEFFGAEPEGDAFRRILTGGTP